MTDHTIANPLILHTLWTTIMPLTFSPQRVHIHRHHDPSWRGGFSLVVLVISIAVLSPLKQAGASSDNQIKPAFLSLDEIRPVADLKFPLEDSPLPLCIWSQTNINPQAIQLTQRRVSAKLLRLSNIMNP